MVQKMEHHFTEKAKTAAAKKDAKKTKAAAGVGTGQALPARRVEVANDEDAGGQVDDDEGGNDGGDAGSAEDESSSAVQANAAWDSEELVSFSLGRLRWLAGCTQGAHVNAAEKHRDVQKSSAAEAQGAYKARLAAIIIKGIPSGATPTRWQEQRHRMRTDKKAKKESVITPSTIQVYDHRGAACRNSERYPGWNDAAAEKRYLHDGTVPGYTEWTSSLKAKNPTSWKRVASNNYFLVDGSSGVAGPAYPRFTIQAAMNNASIQDPEYMAALEWDPVDSMELFPGQPEGAYHAVTDEHVVALRLLAPTSREPPTTANLLEVVVGISLHAKLCASIASNATLVAASNRGNVIDAAVARILKSCRGDADADANVDGDSAGDGDEPASPVGKRRRRAVVHAEDAISAACSAACITDRFARATVRAECATLIADGGFVRDLEFTTVQSSAFLLLAEEADAFKPNNPDPSPLLFRALSKVLKRDIIVVVEPKLVAGIDANITYDAYVAVYHCSAVAVQSAATPLQLHLDSEGIVKLWSGSVGTTWG